jgi:predicted permease
MILTIACGYVLVVTRILPADRWGGIQVLSFRLLIPVFLIKVIAASELSFAKFGPLVLNLVISLALASLFVLVLCWVINREHLPGPAFTTLFQWTTLLCPICLHWPADLDIDFEHTVNLKGN